MRSAAPRTRRATVSTTSREGSGDAGGAWCDRPPRARAARPRRGRTEADRSSSPRPAPGRAAVVPARAAARPRGRTCTSRCARARPRRCARRSRGGRARSRRRSPTRRHAAGAPRRRSHWPRSAAATRRARWPRPSSPTRAASASPTPIGVALRTIGRRHRRRRGDRDAARRPRSASSARTAGSSTPARRSSWAPRCARNGERAEAREVLRAALDHDVAHGRERARRPRARGAGDGGRAAAPRPADAVGPRVAHGRARTAWRRSPPRVSPTARSPSASS